MTRRTILTLLALMPSLALAAEPAAATKVLLKTNMGEIVIELNPTKAPITVENFLGYVKKKHYDGTVFHRVIDGFMIQGGGFAMVNGTPTEKETGKGIKNESANGLSNQRGTIAMARTSEPDSATAQFFINVNNNSPLDHPNYGGYAVFGKVVKGMEVVDRIKSLKTGVQPLAMRNPRTGETMAQGQPDVPLEPVVIESASIVE